MSIRRLPDWLRLWCQQALLGEVYPAIRAIAVGFSASRDLTFRVYFDHEPTEDDRENMDIVVTNILANTSRASEITSIHQECIFSERLIKDLDDLDGFVYARREYFDD